MRPIDADALIEKCGDWYVEEGTESGFIGTLENLLATEPTIQPQSTTGQLNDGARSTAQSTDLIDRQAAINAINSWRGRFSEEYNEAIDDCENSIKELQTAQPEPTYEQVEEYCKRRCLHVVTADFFESTKPQRLGHWIQYDKRFPWRRHYKCSECGNYLDFTGVNGGRGEANYCPNCGAKMRGEQHETD